MKNRTASENKRRCSDYLDPPSFLELSVERTKSIYPSRAARARSIHSLGCRERNPNWTRVRASLRLERADCLVGAAGCGALMTLDFIMMAEYLGWGG